MLKAKHKSTMQEYRVMGVDIGGSHITAAAVDLKSGQIVPGTVVRKPVDAHGSLNEILLLWTSVIREVFALQRDVTRIGIAMPGPFDYEKGISYIRGNDKFKSLYGINLKGLLAAELQIDPDFIGLTNDAACFLRGEVLGGTARHFRHAVGITLGTGLGSAVHHHGFTEDADLWHTPFRDTIAEEYLSTRWFVKRFKELTNRKVNNVLELVQSADPAVKIIFHEFAIQFAEFIVPVLQRHQAEVLVLGGNITKASHLFLETLTHLLQRQSLNIPVYISSLGEQASLVGAAGCWLESHPIAGREHTRIEKS